MEENKWVCPEHNQDEWWCIKDEDGYEIHSKKYEWPDAPKPLANSFQNLMYLIPVDKKVDQ